MIEPASLTVWRRAILRASERCDVLRFDALRAIGRERSYLPLTLDRRKVTNDEDRIVATYTDGTLATVDVTRSGRCYPLRVTRPDGVTVWAPEASSTWSVDDALYLLLELARQPLEVTP